MAARGRKLLKARRRVEFKHTRTHVRRDDQVQVMAGEDRGKIGKVLSVLPARERVVVEGVNLVFRHVRRTQQNPQGGRVQREAPVAISSVALLCPKCNRGRRAKTRVEGDDKTRVCATCGSEFGG